MQEAAEGSAAIENIDIPWNLILSKKVSQWIHALAKSQATLPEYALMSLLPMVNGLVGKNTSILMRDDVYEYSPSVYCVVVGRSGTNKTGAHNLCLRDPVRHVEVTTSAGLLVDQFTTAGLHARLRKTNGEAILANDDCRTTLKVMVKMDFSPDEERVFHKLWWNLGWTREMTRKKDQVVEDTNVCIGGTITYNCVARYLRDFHDADDGILDRLLICFVKPYFSKSTDRKEGKRQLEELAPVDLKAMAEQIYRHHHGTEACKYRLTDKAYKYLEQVHDADLAIFDELLPIGEYRRGEDAAKIHGNVAKVALGLHLLETYVTAQLERRPVELSYELDKEVIERAIRLFIHCQGQTNTYIKALFGQTPGLRTVPARIMSMPGHMLKIRDIRFHLGSKIGTTAIIASCASLASRGGGMLRLVKVKVGKPFEVFIKTRPELIPSELLTELVLSAHRYREQFHKDPDNEVADHEDPEEEIAAMLLDMDQSP